MAFSKASEFPQSAITIASICKLCSHPARIIMLRRLISTNGYISYPELVKDIPLSNPTLSQHLAYIRASGWLTSVNSGSTTEHKLSTLRPRIKYLLKLIILNYDQMHFVEHS